MSNTAKFSTAGQIRATSALLKFCRDHRHTPFFVGKLEECLEAVSANDHDRALGIVDLLSRAGMGSFLDWYPEVISTNEDPEYVETVWWALTSHWKQTLKAAK